MMLGIRLPLLYIQSGKYSYIFMKVCGNNAKLFPIIYSSALISTQFWSVRKGPRKHGKVCHGMYSRFCKASLILWAHDRNWKELETTTVWCVYWTQIVQLGKVWRCHAYIDSKDCSGVLITISLAVVGALRNWWRTIVRCLVLSSS